MTSLPLFITSTRTGLICEYFHSSRHPEIKVTKYRKTKRKYHIDEINSSAWHRPVRGPNSLNNLGLSSTNIWVS